MNSVLLFHPGASMSTADVCAGLSAGLQAQGVRVDEYPLDRQIVLHGKMLEWLWEQSGKVGETYTSADVIFKAGKEVLADACRCRRLYGTEWVIVVSGMYQHPDYLIYLRDAGFKVAMLLTESPYDLEYELRAIDRRDVTGAREPVANVVFTNERTCVDTFRAIQPKTYYLPHAWNPHAVPHAGDVAAHDVVFVGTYFEERIALFHAIDWTGIDLGLYGGTEDLAESPGGEALLPYVRGGYCSNAVTAALYRQAQVGLNLHRTSKGYLSGEHITAAESLNPRCYELAASGQFFVTDYRAELADVLPMVQSFATPQECQSLIRSALAGPAWAAHIAGEARRAVAPHTWDARAMDVVAALTGRASETYGAGNVAVA